MDQKGRVLLPKHVRQFLKVNSGTEILLVQDNENKQIKLVPLVNEHTMELRFIMNDAPGSLATVADTLSDNGINIILSESRTLVKGKIAEWDIIVDTRSKKGDIEDIKKKLIESNTIKRMEVLRE